MIMILLVKNNHLDYLNYRFLLLLSLILTSFHQLSSKAVTFINVHLLLSEFNGTLNDA
jgi:hypothetical protein